MMGSRLRAGSANGMAHLCGAAESLKDNADLVLGGIVLARDAATISDKFFGWCPHGWGRGFLAHLHSPWGQGEPEILRYSNCQFGPLGANEGR